MARTSKIKAGDRFGRLTVLRKTDKKIKGNFLWECECECGNTCLVKTCNLNNGKVVSCGCYHDEGYKHFDKIRPLGTKKLQEARIDGTSIYNINSKVPITNTTGYKGISKGQYKKYRVTLQFQKKQYSGGEYDDLQEAIKARKALEDKYFKPIIDKTKKNPTSN
ncbi:hypothetical protein [Facklamia sp. P9177]|uniref:hypothetical protein n=1 Tax=Facklamia sp. P9177 TaxID=3421945 RepID=UPI003D162802